MSLQFSPEQYNPNVLEKEPASFKQKADRYRSLMEVPSNESSMARREREEEMRKLRALMEKEFGVLDETIRKAGIATEEEVKRLGLMKETLEELDLVNKD